MRPTRQCIYLLAYAYCIRLTELIYITLEMKKVWYSKNVMSYKSEQQANLEAMLTMPTAEKHSPTAGELITAARALAASPGETTAALVFAKLSRQSYRDVLTPNLDVEPFED